MTISTNLGRKTIDTKIRVLFVKNARCIIVYKHSNKDEKQ